MGQDLDNTERQERLSFEEVSAVQLTRVFGATRALSGVTATLRAHQVTVIEGPNGSGKSTLLSLLAQLSRPTRGEVHYGEHPASELDRIALRAEIGVLAHAAMIYPDLSGLENLELYGRLHALENPDEKVASLVDRFEIGRWGQRPARTYSRGQLQRISLARALIHSPKLLLLDEPSTGLDVRTVGRLIRAVEDERERGAIIALITHDPELSKALADKFIRLERGRLVDRKEPGKTEEAEAQP